MNPRNVVRLTLSTAATVLALAAFAPRRAETAPSPPTTHTVRMVADANGAGRFEPANLTIRVGDVVRFVNVSGGPHNVSFDPATLPAGMQHVMETAMADQMQPLWGKLVSGPNEAYTISFAGAKPGRYPFFCVPHMYDKSGHMTMAMKGVITVQ